MAEARSSAPLDCTRCGACCSNPLENRAEGFVGYVEVLARDPLLALMSMWRRFLPSFGVSICWK